MWKSSSKKSTRKHFWATICHRITQLLVWTLYRVPMWLSTRTLKPDSLDADPRSRFNMYFHELHMARRLSALHCWTVSRALSRSTAHNLDPDWGHVEAKWSLNPNPWSASDPDPSSRVESPNVSRFVYTLCVNFEISFLLPPLSNRISQKILTFKILSL